MRDHPAHNIEILGSAWGVRLGEPERILADQAFTQAAHDKLFWMERKSYGPDQGFLKKYIWPWGKWSAVSHDAYTCANFPRTRAFPTQRDVTKTSNFVASVISANDIMKEKCPLTCRPASHKDWEYC